MNSHKILTNISQMFTMLFMYQSRTVPVTNNFKGVGVIFP